MEVHGTGHPPLEMGESNFTISVMLQGARPHVYQRKDFVYR